MFERSRLIYRVVCNSLEASHFKQASRVKSGVSDSAIDTLFHHQQSKYKEQIRIVQKAPEVKLMRHIMANLFSISNTSFAILVFMVKKSSII